MVLQMVLFFCYSTRMYTSKHIPQMKQHLRDRVPRDVYRRGESYHKKGRVKHLSYQQSATDDSVSITADVKGREKYHTHITYRSHNAGKGHWDTQCSCPMHTACKHSVAVALAFFDTLSRTPNATQKQMPHTTQPAAAATPSVPHDAVLSALKSIGIDTEHLPQATIDSLIAFQQSSTQQQQQSNTPPATPLRPFSAQRYTILLHRDKGYRPSFHPKNRLHTNTSIDNILEKYDLSEDERLLLEYIAHNHEKYYYNYSYDDDDFDPAVLFSLIHNTSFDVCVRNGMYSFGADPATPIRILADPKPFPIRLACIRIPYYVEKGGEDMGHEKEIVLAFGNDDPHEKHDTVRYDLYDGGIVHEKKNTLCAYTTPPEISKHLYHIEQIPTPKYEPREVLCTGKRMKKAGDIQELLSLGSGTHADISLTIENDVRTMGIHTEKPERLFLVECDSEARTLKVTPTARYAVLDIPIPEAVSCSHSSGRKRYYRKSVGDADPEHAISETADALHFTTFDAQEEVAFYKEIEKHYEQLGFTKTLKCTRRGNRQFTQYLAKEWHALQLFAEEKGYPIHFTKDALPTERVAFTADFTSDINTDDDWLHFDVDLYCGGDKVTLEQLYAFLESGETYWKKEDGTLVEVENREELERLVRLLKNFRAKENGFEGNIHHTPELSYVMTSSPHYNTKQSEGLKAFIKQVEKGKPIKAVQVPKHIKQIARPYQIEGIKWLHFLRSYRFAGILADDMGLGKTLQALTLLAMTRTPELPSLVVCPKSLLHNWHSEAARFFPDMRVLVYDGTPQEREALREHVRDYDMIVVNYHTLQKDHEFLCGESMRYNYAVLDEAQYIKNHASKIAQRVKEIPADYRLALTGTPLENHVFEVWSIFDYLMPGFLGKHEQFKTHYHKPIMEYGSKDTLTHLHKKVSPFMLRRTKTEVLKDLPPKIEQLQECILSEDQNILYQQILTDVRGNVRDVVAEKGFKGAQIHILAGLTKLRQVCNHPALLTKETHETYTSTKLDTCLELISDIRQNNKKVLVFSQFTGMLDILQDSLQKAEIPHTYLSGKTKNRREVVERFNTDPDITAFLISMKAGGTGLNLTSADTVIVFDPWWNPSVENQAIDRAHRIGQQHSVHVYRLVTKGTIEEKIQALKVRKQNVFDAVVNESGDLFKKLTWDDVKELFA
jgi:SNF2 family DNA or RNA helicase